MPCYIRVVRVFTKSFAAFLVLAAAFPAAAKDRPLGKNLKAALEQKRLPGTSVGISGPVILDPGHGGADWGATVSGVYEKDIVLAIAKKLQERLGAVPVKLTRDSDVFVTLDGRVEQSLDLNGGAFVSLHVNQVRRKDLQGITIYAFGRTHRHWWNRRHRSKVPPLPPPPKDEVKASLALAVSVGKTLRAEGLRVNQMDRAEYYVLKNPRIPSILIEMGYLSNPEEGARLNDPEYQDRLAAALAKSLQEYLAQTQAPKPAKLARYDAR